MRILIAEDDLTSRVMLSELLKKGAHEVVEAANGAEAWDKLREPDAPKLAIIDWMMPETDGLEVVRLVRALPTARPPYIIMLTARDEEADILDGLNTGANDYLIKPFNPDELRARVEVGRRMVEIQDALASKITELEQAFEQIKTLRGIVPICANCKKIRDDAGYWQQVDVYISNHTEAEFTHGICPECLKTLYPDYFD